MSPLALILTIILVLLLFGSFPAWGYHSYGYAPTGGIGLLLLILLVLILLGKI